MYSTDAKAYVTNACRLKKLGKSDFSALDSVCDTAFSRVYRAIALDVDGTITPESDVIVDNAMAGLIARLLHKGIPVILISGRGRSSVRDAANQIQAASGISNWYLRRLHCVGYNGAFRTFTRSSRPNEFLSEYDPLVVISSGQKNVLSRLITGNAQLIDKQILELGFVRIKQQSEHHGRVLKKDLNDLAEILQKIPPQLPWAVTQSTYKTETYWSISATDKNFAIGQLAERLGLPESTILRVGDSGHEDGNDASLLDCDSGFSVGTLSNSLKGCLPVLDKGGNQLMGVDATRLLIQALNIFPPLSLQAGSLDKRVEDLTGFEKLVTMRSRSEAVTIEGQINAKHRSLLPTGVRIRGDSIIAVNEIYDLQSGAVKLRFWEIEGLYKKAPKVVHLFRLPHEFVKVTEIEGIDSFAIFSDTSLLLRGPVYYWSLTDGEIKNSVRTDKICRTAKSVDQFVLLHKEFFLDAINLFSDPWIQGYNVVQLKIILAILDQARNFLATLLYVEFVSDLRSSDSPIAQALFDLLVQVVDTITKTLFDLDFGWHRICKSSEKVLKGIESLINSYEFSPLMSWCRNSSEEVFKYRECDHFLQNLSAIQIALRDFVRHEVISINQEVTAYGLAYGGLELPAICKSVGDRMGIRILPKIAKISLYGDKKIDREKVYEAGAAYVQGLRGPMNERSYFDKDKIPDSNNCLILDDNCTTCSTLQMARDALVVKGYQVRGCVAVRYPSTNRLLHMGLRAHGFPDPENLLSFVRGLVAPSPYSRLLKEGESDGERYLDGTGIFDKSKERIKRYIRKHLHIKNSTL